MGWKPIQISDVTIFCSSGARSQESDASLCVVRRVPAYVALGKLRNSRAPPEGKPPVGTLCRENPGKNHQTLEFTIWHIIIILWIIFAHCSPESHLPFYFSFIPHGKIILECNILDKKVPSAELPTLDQSAVAWSSKTGGIIFLILLRKVIWVWCCPSECHQTGVGWVRS